MRIPRFPGVRVAIATAFSLLFLLPGCSLNVKKNEKGEGEKVDIQTPVGGIHVSQDANPRDTGLATYPGARQKEKSSQHDGNNANVNISSGFFGIKVVAIEFVSDDPPEKVAAFYRDQLTVHWLDIFALVGIGGVWLAVYARQLTLMPLLPLHDPNATPHKAI